ncbi:methylated-DNA--[protein]-cysteine S-methyltransferase [Rhodospirillum rubrum]|uniref:Methylated-DNA--protein-cysteine methyltransferase n=1 Tax=Rhodospirillum rubrum (strain ATCC 11170 / ATH 1.1.1 / DSM 467 / LMG 4362 / NCIMB 8255 / S1) TaxID=269796 RepID=Q2RNZ3_RHORT|nr:methylated-DNA--[protein]-cysteine S-methyltransferase [Rhodospirillum rubrum]ABC24152.1 Methylated-DNA--(protein)-cysteine S-methyltransferase [Rhodospirillum rubrum ATCC 11170]MBK5955866.1 cysteine methyltransferase [Rhodospirillum rubrum]QXG80092.1 methylated-DNA--[protein]-cysteine S-methyltransferase [Rhodospirillum rubrum]HAP98833.1 cysteine methyltransferase [Rhodospirillum rubrum]
MTPLFIDRPDSPLGRLLVVADDQSLRGVDFADNEARLMRLLEVGDGAALIPKDDPLGASSALAAYFAGDLTALDALPVHYGGTPFQNRVWKALRTIAFGQTLSYAALAERIGAPGACRAVGRANGLNPLSLVLPCHRVIGGSGALTGYAGGLARKAWLLRHEGLAIEGFRLAPAPRLSDVENCRPPIPGAGRPTPAPFRRHP